MAFVPGFGNDVFISYSHIDNQSVEGDGWVSDLHKRLRIMLDWTVALLFKNDVVKLDLFGQEHPLHARGPAPAARPKQELTV